MRLNVAAQAIGFPYWLEMNYIAWLYKKHYPQRMTQEVYSDFIRMNMMGGEPYQTNSREIRHGT